MIIIYHDDDDDDFNISLFFLFFFWGGSLSDMFCSQMNGTIKMKLRAQSHLTIRKISACLFNIPDIFVNGVILSFPRFSAVNCITIHRQPFSHLQQSLLKCWYDATICSWTNIQQHVSTTANQNKGNR